jgi:uncharacterized protein (DUF1697 family)
MARYVALLRGINVGGNNLIRMADLAACFEQNGFETVKTFIQSGNVIFETRRSRGELSACVEQMLSKRFSYSASVVIRSHAEMRSIVEDAPKGFGKQPDRYRYDVLFLKAPLTAANAMKSVRVKEGVDHAHPGKGVLYFSRLISKATQSQLSKIVGTPIYASLTIRNWNTTTKLLALLEA